MACSSLVALPRACGADGIVAGLEKLYIVAYTDLKIISGTSEVYSASTTGIVNNISLNTSKKFVEVGMLKSTSGLNETLTKDNKTGTAFFTTNMTLVLSNLTNENKIFVESVLNQPVAILLKSRTGSYYATGFNGQFELSALEGGTGIAEGDLIGYTLTFEGIGTKLVPLVDPTIVAALIA